MRIKNRFTVSIPLDVAWKVLQDLERIAPCMPGAQLQEVDGDEYRGTVRVKVGSTVTQFKGAVRFAEVDEAAHRIVLKAQGRQARGDGDARATFTAVLAPAGAASTDVAVDSNLSITGKLASFGRDVLADVSSRLLDEFGSRLEAELARDEVLNHASKKKTAAKKAPARRAAAATVQTPSVKVPLTTIDARQPAASVSDDGGANATAALAPTEPQVTPIEPGAAAPVDLLALGGRPLVVRGLPVALVAVLLVLALSKERGARLALAAVGVALVLAMAKQAAQTDS